MEGWNIVKYKIYNLKQFNWQNLDGWLFFAHTYIDVHNCIDKFQLIFFCLILLLKQLFYDKWLYVTNLFHLRIVALIFRHNDRLRCEPPLVAHFNWKNLAHTN
jgi:hypothetical protein